MNHTKHEAFVSSRCDNKDFGLYNSTQFLENAKHHLTALPSWACLKFEILCINSNETQILRKQEDNEHFMIFSS